MTGYVNEMFVDELTKNEFVLQQAQGLPAGERELRLARVIATAEPSSVVNLHISRQDRLWLQSNTEDCDRC